MVLLLPSVAVNPSLEIMIVYRKTRYHYKQYVINWNDTTSPLAVTLFVLILIIKKLYLYLILKQKTSRGHHSHALCCYVHASNHLAILELATILPH